MMSAVALKFVLILLSFAQAKAHSLEEDDDENTRSLLSSSPNFPCAPPSVQSADYSTWSKLERLQFSLCYDTNDKLLDLIVSQTRQMSVGDACDTGDPMWRQIKPGTANNDYFEEFHEDVPIPPEFRLRNDSPVAARVLNEIGFQAVYELLTGSSSICDSMRPGDMPIECRDKTCQCWQYVPKMINHYTVHFTVFKEAPKPPVTLEWNPDTKKCSFPKETKKCMVQPNEKVVGGYLIPCFDDTEKCLIVGNDTPCTLRNTMNTIQGYNEYAKGERERLVPFRLHYPIACKCTNRTPRSIVPSTGFTMDNLITISDLVLEDVALEDFDLSSWIAENRHPHVSSGQQSKCNFRHENKLFYTWIICSLAYFWGMGGNPLR